MELTFIADNEILLPDWIASTDLTLAEIGSIAALACMLSTKGDCPHLAARIASPEMKAAMQGLKDRGLINAAMAGSVLKVEIDLDVAEGSRFPTTH